MFYGFVSLLEGSISQHESQVTMARRKCKAPSMTLGWSFLKKSPTRPRRERQQKKTGVLCRRAWFPPPQENDRKNMRCLFSKWWSKNNCGMWKFQKVALICLGRCFSSPSNVCDFFVCPEKKSCWTFSTTKNRITSQTSLCLAAWSIVRARSWYFCHLFFFGEPGVFHLWWSSRGLGRGMALLC